MTRTVLVEASPSDPATGVVRPTYLAGLGSRPYLWRGINEWRSGVRDIPRFTTELDFGDSGWTGGAIPQTAAIVFTSADIRLVSDLARLYWKDADIVVRIDDDELPAPTWPIALRGRVAAVEQGDGALTLTIGDLGVKLNAMMLDGYFAGTGGLEGGTQATNLVKRRTFGRAYNIEGRILDTVNLIYEFGDPRRQFASIDTVRVGGREGPITVLAWQGSAEATLSALIATAPAKGGGIAAPSIACVKWWTTAGDTMTADVRGEIGTGYTETVAGIAREIVLARSTLDVANRDEINVIRPEVAGIHCDSNSETIGGVLDRLLVGSSLLWVLEPEGAIRIAPWSLEVVNPTITWAGTRNAPLTWTKQTRPAIAWDRTRSDTSEIIVSQGVSRKATYAPIKKRRIGYRANNRVMNDGEILAVVLADDVAFGNGDTLEKLSQVQPGATRNVFRGEWAAGQNYAIGDTYRYEGSSYEVTTAHTSSADAPPPNASSTLFVAAGVDGQTLYTWTAFANSADGTVDFTTGDPAGRAYFAVKANQTVAAESTNPADYQFVKIKGDDAAAKPVSTAPIGGIIARVLAVGEAVFASASIFGTATQNGTINVSIQVSPTGANQWVTIRSGDAQPIGPGEPAGTETSGAFTNQTNMRQSFDIRAINSGNVSATLRPAQSFLVI